MKEVTIDSVFINTILAGARQQGLDCDPLVLRHGISAIALNKANARVQLDAFAAVALDVMRTLDDEFLGLSQTPQPLGSFGMMAHSCISARTLGRSLKRCIKFWNLFNNAYTHSLQIKNDQVSYILRPIKGQSVINHYLVEAALSSVHRFHCWLGGQFIPLDKVTLGYAEPDYSAEFKQIFYGAQMEYGQAESRFVFDSRLLDLEIVQTPETLDQYLASDNLSLIYQPKNYRSIGDQVRRWLEKNINQGNYQATLKQASGYFKLSQQVLHRRLQAEDLSFKEIKMQTRRDIAINLLFTDQHRIEEIATKVGFSEPSAFIRAFKAWTGSTPLAYRNHHR